MAGDVVLSIPSTAIWGFVVLVIGHAVASLIYVLRMESRIQVIETRLTMVNTLVERVQLLTDRLSEVNIRLARIEIQLETVISREKSLEMMMRDRTE